MSRSDRPSRNRRAIAAGRDGFTLVEVLVAFLVLVMATTAIHRAIGTSVLASVQADERLRAQRVARSLMTAPLGRPARNPPPQTGTMDGLHWTLRFRPVDLPFPATVDALGNAPVFKPVRMIVAVALPSGGTLEVDVVRLVRIPS